MSRFALALCAAICVLLALANVAIWHVEAWMPLAVAAALAFVFAMAQRARTRALPVRVSGAVRQIGEPFAGGIRLDQDGEDAV